MPEAWRIIKQKHVATAFTGKGAADSGGRWNSRGVAVVYASSSKSLAALEMLVHLNPTIRFKYMAIRIVFDDTLIESLSSRRLPSNWRTQPVPPSTQRIGDDWIGEAHSAV